MSDVDTTTPIVGLIKPAFDGRADVREINTDMDLIDARFGTLVGAVINPMSAPGDLIVGGTSGAPGKLAIGTNGQHLVVSGGTAAWAPSVGFNNPMTALSDLIVGGASGAATRLGVGAPTQVLTVQAGGTVAWQAPVSGGMTNPMTGVGDLIVGGASGAANRLAAGTGGQVLTMVGGTAAWQALPPDVGFANPMTASGDLIRGGASGAATRVAPGSANQVLTIQGGVPAWLGGAATVLVGDVFGDGHAGLIFGSASDTVLYRAAADTLRTDDGLVVAGAGGLLVSGAGGLSVTVGGATFSGGGVVVSSAGGLSVSGAAGAAVTTGPLVLSAGATTTQKTASVALSGSGGAYATIYTVPANSYGVLHVSSTASAGAFRTYQQIIWLSDSSTVYFTNGAAWSIGGASGSNLTFSPSGLAVQARGASATTPDGAKVWAEYAAMAAGG